MQLTNSGAVIFLDASSCATRFRGLVQYQDHSRSEHQVFEYLNSNAVVWLSHLPTWMYMVEEIYRAEAW